MAKMIVCRSVLTPSTPLIPSFSHNSLRPLQSFAISAKPSVKTKISGKPSGARMSSSTAAPVVPDDIANELGEVSIFTAAGEPVKFKDLWDQQELPFPSDSLYADPDRKAYNILGLYFGVLRTFLNPASIKVFSRLEEVKKAMKNYTIKATPSDRSSVLQQGGMFVFKGKQLLYARKDEGTGDHAPLDDILNICCKVPTS
ncbi:hypothetical protein ACS0TY_006401 [Phlomoides rotata]